MRSQTVAIALVTMTILHAGFLVAQEPVRVVLDESGIGDWRFLNTLKPESVEKQSLEFVNTTGDRTFVVTIPYESEVSSSEFLAAHVERNESLSLPNFVCRALGDLPGDQEGLCFETKSLVDAMTRLESLKNFQELVRLGKLKDPAACSSENPGGACADVSGSCQNACSDNCSSNQPAPKRYSDPSRFNLTCELETLYWTAACQVLDSEARALATRKEVPAALKVTLDDEAAAFVARLFGGSARDRLVGCGVECAWCRREQVLDSLRFTPAPAPATREQQADTNLDEVSAIVESNAHDAAIAQFESGRLEAARAAVLTAARKRSDAIFEGADVKRINAALEAKQKLLERQIDFSGSEEDLLARCELRELQVGARLLASYSTASTVPFDVPPDVRDQPCHPQKRVAQTRTETIEYLRSRPVVAPIDTGASVDILDCKVKDGKRVCVASAVIPPNQTAVFSADVLGHHPEPHITFRVSYFGETENPPNAVGYVVREKGAKPKEEGKAVLGFGLETGSAYDLPSEFQGHNRHSSGAGSISFLYTGLTRLDFSATLQFKNGDFGGPDASNQISASQYQAKVAFGNGISLQSGLIRFASPSAGIAVSERGEGFRLAVGWGTATYIVRRESDTADRSPDPDDDDSDVLLLQFNPRIPHLRNFLATVLQGRDRNDRPSEVKNEETGLVTRTFPVPYSYTTFGLDARLGVPWTKNAVLSVAGYHSRRNMSSLPEVAAETPLLKEVLGTPHVDGEGSVGLLTLIYNGTQRTPLGAAPSKAERTYAVTLWAGAGSGDDPQTSNRDEGYLGETARYANDQIFLSQIASDKTYGSRLGRGLSNKYYLGSQYSDARVSPLAWIARLLGVASSDIEKRATTVSGHAYWFNQSIDHARFAGYELDVNFQVEVPANVNWFVSGGWYRPGRSVERLVEPYLLSNPWQISTGVSINLE